jgi:hypothetical protein
VCSSPLVGDDPLDPLRHPVAHVMRVRDHAGARSKLLLQDRAKRKIRLRSQVQGDDCRRGEIDGKASWCKNLTRCVTPSRFALRLENHTSRASISTPTPRCSITFRHQDHDTPVPRAQVVDNVILCAPAPTAASVRPPRSALARRRQDFGGRADGGPGCASQQARDLLRRTGMTRGTRTVIGRRSSGTCGRNARGR